MQGRTKAVPLGSYTGFVVALTLLLSWAFYAAQGGDAAADQRRAPQPHFKSGGERSEELLREILTTLQRMDQRLERFEKAADRLSPEVQP